MTPSPTLLKFITYGTKPKTDREAASLLDECRSLFAELAAGPSSATASKDSFKNLMAECRAFVKENPGTNLGHFLAYKREAIKPPTPQAKAEPQDAHELLASKAAEQRAKLVRQGTITKSPASASPAKPAATSTTPLNLTGVARTAAAFAGKPASPRDAATPTGYARVVAAFKKGK